MKNIVLIGGAEDRIKDKVILQEIIKLGKRIAIIPTALKRDPLESYDKYVDAFREFDIRPEVIDIRTSEEANLDKHLDILDNIDTIYFTGGDQVRLFNILTGSKFLDKLRKKVLNKQINYVGTSAGAMITGFNMIYDGDYKGSTKGYVKNGRGFGLLLNVLVDTHYNKRNRFYRLTQNLLAGIGNVGIGISEDTALFINEYKVGKVIGSREVIIIDTEKSFSNYDNIGKDEKINATDIKISFHGHGSLISLDRYFVK